MDESKTDEEKPISLDHLEERINILFGQNIYYQRMREKIIGITLYYSPNLKNILESLVRNSSLNTDLKKLLKGNLTFFDNYMAEANHKNIRTNMC